MLKSYLLLLSLLLSSSYIFAAKEKIIKSKVSEATIFFSSAQLKRIKTIDIPKGETILKFVKISAAVEKNSIQIKNNGNITVLSVNYKNKNDEIIKNNMAIKKLNQEIKKIVNNITFINKNLEITREEISFLKENSKITGKGIKINSNEYKNISSFFGKKFRDLKMKEFYTMKEIDSLRLKKDQITNKVRKLINNAFKTSGEIVIKIKSNKKKKCDFEISYVTKNVSWLPSYDVRAKNIKEPLQIIYKANINQNTGIDWNNVKLTVSSATPNRPGDAPQLQKYYLTYNKRTHRYNNERSKIALRKQAIMKIRERKMKRLEMEKSSKYAEGYGSGFSGASGNFSAVPPMNFSKVNSVNIKNQTNVNFEITTPYSIKSNAEIYTVNMAIYNVKANYKYYAVPKIEKSAFLIANITDWEKYNLLSGNANLYFENTFVGKIVIDPQKVDDTLKISLGRDNKISIDRKKVHDFSKNNFFGSKGTITKAWETTIKNNKNENINITVMDQVPISTNEKIVVKNINITDKKVDKEKGVSKNGIFSWDISLKPKESKKLKLKYSVEAENINKLILE